MNYKHVIAAITVCFAIGFLVGRNGTGPTSETPNTSLAHRARTKLGLSTHRSTGTSPIRNRSLPSASGQFADPIAQMEFILNVPNTMERAEAWLHFAKGLGSDEIEEVVASFRSRGHASSDHWEYSVLLNTWTDHTPLEAIEYASKNTGTPLAREVILQSWATTDPSSAIRWVEGWVEKNPKDSRSNRWMLSVIDGVSYSNPNLAMELVRAIPDEQHRIRGLRAVQSHYIKQGPAAARAWATSIDDKRLRDNAIELVAQNLARTDPKGTGDWLVTSPIEDEEIQKRTTNMILKSLNK